MINRLIAFNLFFMLIHRCASLPSLLFTITLLRDYITNDRQPEHKTSRKLPINNNDVWKKWVILRFDLI
jgi:hypothetical protein